MDAHVTTELIVAPGTTPASAVALASNMMDSAHFSLLEMASGGRQSVDEQRHIWGILYSLECAEKLVEHANVALREQQDPATPTATLASVLADAYALGSEDMAVIEGFLRSHRVGGLNIDPDSLRASDDAKLRAMWGVK